MRPVKKPMLFPYEFGEPMNSVAPPALKLSEATAPVIQSSAVMYARPPVPRYRLMRTRSPELTGPEKDDSPPPPSVGKIEVPLALKTS